MAVAYHTTATLPPCLSPPSSLRPSPLSWSASIALSLIPPPPRIALALLPPSVPNQQSLVVRAVWTWRSHGEAEKSPNHKSWKQRTDMYTRPFLLNVFFSKCFVHAKVVHWGTSKVISIASTNAKDLRNMLPSLIDDNTCKTIGHLIAKRSMDANIFAMSYEPKKNERVKGKLGIVIDTIKEHGIIFV